MKKNNLVKLLGIALVVAIVSTGIFYGLFVNKLTSSTGSERTLVVAAKALKAGTQIQTADVKTIPWPSQQVPQGFYGTVDQVAGSTVFDPIGVGEPVVAAHLASAQTGGTSGVPTGMRAVSIHVADSTGVLALLRAGQKVDAQVVVRQKDVPGGTQIRTALEDLRVLSVQSQPEVSSQGATLPVVTLLANPAEADVLAAADAGAQVRLTLRNPLDDTTRARAAVTVESVMRTSGTPNAPAVSNGPSQTVEPKAASSVNPAPIAAAKP
ncbi:MAG TPA: Flp pilus assembly protein CpaB [Bryobacteraceae bacterium]|nr:Flp pilus assembly protein CpaB [Bryobacteraceae bacterium]